MQHKANRLLVLVGVLFLALGVAEACDRKEALKILGRAGVAPVLTADTFYAAAKAGDIEALQRHLDAGLSVELSRPEDWDGESPLMTAIRAEQVEAVKFLVKNGASLVKQAGGWDMGVPTYSAISLVKSPAMIRGLNEMAGSKPQKAINKDIDPKRLDAAVKAGDLDEVKKLVALGVDVNATTQENFMGEKFTPVWSALKQPNKEILRVLIQGGADLFGKTGIRIVDTEGTHLPSTAFELSDSVTRKFIFELMGVQTRERQVPAAKAAPVVPLPRPEPVPPKRDAAAAHKAAGSGDIAGLRRFFEEGGHPDATNPGDAGMHSLLMTAVQNGQKDAAKYLIWHGASLLEKTGGWDRDYATYNAIDLAQPEMRGLFNEMAGSRKPERKIDPTVSPKLLRDAIVAEDIPAIRALLARGVDVNGKVGKETPVWAAMSGKNKDVLKVLLEEGGADIFNRTGYRQGRNEYVVQVTAFDVGSEELRSYVLTRMGATP